MPPVISVEHLSKSYRLGQIGTGTFARDLSVWWARVRGKPNPLLRIGETDHGNRVGEEIWALRDVSFTVDQGEVLGVIGRNGAGKSTLLKILSRVTAPTSGQVKVRGRIASLLEVGTGFHPELTGRENIYLNGAILGMTRQEVRRKFDEIVAFAEVEKFIDTPVKRYSSGMYVRLAFAVAAHLESEILLVDEVLAVGDAEFQKKCLGKMGDVASKEGRTVLFVSHNMAAMKNICITGILVNKGRVGIKNPFDEVAINYLRFSHDYETVSYSVETEEFYLKAIRVYQDGDNVTQFQTNHPVIIEFSYDIKKGNLNGLRIGFDLYSNDGIVIFRSFDDDMNAGTPRIKGSYITKCTLPSNIFLATDYYIQPRIGIHNVKWISDNDVRLKITFAQLSGVNQKFADRRPGILMPALHWRTDQND